jgi:hypothetical protein
MMAIQLDHPASDQIRFQKSLRGSLLLATSGISYASWVDSFKVTLLIIFMYSRRLEATVHVTAGPSLYGTA